MSQPSLSTRDLTIRFGGHVAVNQVTADFYPGTLTVIVGPNGAGKTTYFNLMSGQLPATSGKVLLDGVDITKHGAAKRTRLGIGRAFQLTNLFPHLTVMENVRLAVQSRAVIAAVQGGEFLERRYESYRRLRRRYSDLVEARGPAQRRR